MCPTIKKIEELQKITDPIIWKNVHDWVTRVDTPISELAGHKLCPFAKTAESSIIITPIEIDDFFIIDGNFVFVLFLADPDVTWDDLTDWVDRMSQLNPEIDFLLDSKIRTETYGSYVSSNLCHNFIVSQPKRQLEAARNILKKSNYYDCFNTTLDKNQRYFGKTKLLNDLNASWTKIYGQIKDISWPVCNHIDDFKTLPQKIQKEILYSHDIDNEIKNFILKIYKE